jgi:hypothetical protein
MCSPVKYHLRVGFACHLLFAGYLLGLHFDPEDRGSKFIRKLGDLLQYYRCYIPESSTHCFLFIFTGEVSR